MKYLQKTHTHSHEISKKYTNSIWEMIFRRCSFLLGSNLLVSRLGGSRGSFLLAFFFSGGLALLELLLLSLLDLVFQLFLDGSIFLLPLLVEFIIAGLLLAVGIFVFLFIWFSQGLVFLADLWDNLGDFKSREFSSALSEDFTLVEEEPSLGSLGLVRKVLKVFIDSRLRHLWYYWLDMFFGGDIVYLFLLIFLWFLIIIIEWWRGAHFFY